MVTWKSVYLVTAEHHFVKYHTMTLICNIATVVEKVLIGASLSKSHTDKLNESSVCMNGYHKSISMITKNELLIHHKKLQLPYLVLVLNYR